MCWDTDEEENQIIKTTKWHTKDTNWQLVNMKNSPLLNFSWARPSKHRCPCFLRSIRKTGFCCSQFRLKHNEWVIRPIIQYSWSYSYLMSENQRHNLSPKQSSNTINKCGLMDIMNLIPNFWSVYTHFMSFSSTACPSLVYQCSTDAKKR